MPNYNEAINGQLPLINGNYSEIIKCAIFKDVKFNSMKIANKYISQIIYQNISKNVYDKIYDSPNFGVGPE